MKEINNPERDSEVSLNPDSLRQQEKHIQEAGDEMDNMSLAKGAETSEGKKLNAENGSLKSKDASESEDPLDAYSSDGTKTDVKDEAAAKQELPECFSGLSDEAKQKQSEALGKMSDTERQAYLDVVEKEPKITADVQDITNANGGELQGLEYRVKTPSSTYEKMHGREQETNIGEMKDIIRYTEIYPPDKLAEGTNASLQAFEEKGYTVAKVKNTWDDENSAYKGINTTIVSPEGQAFEVQFHTQESFDLKNGELHSLYEERRVLSAKDPKGLELDDKMFELSDGLTRPDSIEEVKNR